MGSQLGAALGMSEGVCFCCRATLDEAAGASYELTDAEYAANEAGDTWVDHLLGVLVALLQWLQPLLTPSNYDALVASLLQKASRHFVTPPLRGLQTGCAPLITELMQRAAETFQIYHCHMELVSSQTRAMHAQEGTDALQVVDRLEATLRVKRFNQLGGLQLDRDVRHMVVTLSEVMIPHLSLNHSTFAASKAQPLYDAPMLLCVRLIRRQTVI